MRINCHPSVVKTYDLKSRIIRAFWNQEARIAKDGLELKNTGKNDRRTPKIVEMEFE